MDKPRIFLGSSGKQTKLLQALTRGLEDVCHVDPWTSSFTPGTTTLARLVQLAHEVDFAAFVFARDDWTTASPSASPKAESGQASPRDNVVFEAGLFGGTLKMHRTFILHAKQAKLPSRGQRRTRQVVWGARVPIATATLDCSRAITHQIRQPVSQSERPADSPSIHASFDS